MSGGFSSGKEAGFGIGMKFLYNALFTIFFWLAAPFYFVKMWRRGNWQQGFAQRFGINTLSGE